MLYHFLYVFFITTLLTLLTKIDTPETFFSLGFLGINPRRVRMGLTVNRYLAKKNSS